MASKWRYIIYALVDPRTGLVNYIGKSSSGLRRARSHRTANGLGKSPNSRKNTWLRELFAAGFDYEIAIMEEFEDRKAPGTLCWWWTGINQTVLNDAEHYWIAYGRASGWPLTNMTDGGEGSSGGVASAETCAKRSANNVMRQPEHRARQSVNASVFQNTPEASIRLSAKALAWWSQPENLENSRIERSLRWADPTYRAACGGDSNRGRTPALRAARSVRAIGSSRDQGGRFAKAKS